MTDAAIPFVPNQGSGSDSLGGGSPLAVNLVTETTGAIRRRPGIRAYAGVTDDVVDESGLIGIHVTLAGKVVVVGNGPGERTLYRLGASAAVPIGASGNASKLNGLSRPVFAETEPLLIIAGGKKLQKIELASFESNRLGGDPPDATHIVANAQRLLANDASVDRTKIRYSDIAQGTITYAGHEIWDNLTGDGGFISAESRPDPVVAVGETTNEVFVWGTTTLQIFVPDPSTVYSPVATEENGMSAPYSAVKADGQFAWLDQYRRFVMGGGRGNTVLSAPIQRTLNTMTHYEDCFGYRALTGPIDCLVWSFPRDGRTFSFQRGSAWAQWTGLRRSQFPVLCSAQHPITGAILVGLSDGRVGELTLDAEDDFGTPIEAYCETGFLNRGTERRKWCMSVKLALRRGTHRVSQAPVGWLRWRDRPGPWEGEIPVDFGADGDTETVFEVRGLGVYRRREWSFQFDAAGEFLLISATEEYEVLES